MMIVQLRAEAADMNLGMMSALISRRSLLTQWMAIYSADLPEDIWWVLQRTIENCTTLLDQLGANNATLCTPGEDLPPWTTPEADLGPNTGG
jgi:hypothetical protein